MNLSDAERRIFARDLLREFNAANTHIICYVVRMSEGVPGETKDQNGKRSPFAHILDHGQHLGHSIAIPSLTLIVPGLYAGLPGIRQLAHHQPGQHY